MITIKFTISINTQTNSPKVFLVGTRLLMSFFTNNLILGIRFNFQIWFSNRNYEEGGGGEGEGGIWLLFVQVAVLTENFLSDVNF